MSITALFLSVPSQAWIALVTAILTSIITLLGVWLTNWASYKRLKLQLEHDRDIKREELIRDRLEELYTASKKYLNTLCSYYLPYRQVMKGELTFNQALEVTIQTGEKVSYDPGRVTMLIHMYFPEIQPAFDEIMQVRDELNEVLFGYKEQYKQGDTDGREWLLAFQPLLELLSKLCDNFDKNIVKLNNQCTTIGPAGSLRAP